jgi:hypothetical protein
MGTQRTNNKRRLLCTIACFLGKGFGSLIPVGDGELGRLKNFFLYLLLLQNFPRQNKCFR